MPAHMLGNDTHVRAMKIISNNFLHVAHMYFLQLYIREHIRHACILFVHDGIKFFPVSCGKMSQLSPDFSQFWSDLLKI